MTVAGKKTKKSKKQKKKGHTATEQLAVVVINFNNKTTNALIICHSLLYDQRLQFTHCIAYSFKHGRKQL